MVYLGIEGRYDDLAHHMIYIPDDYEKHLREIEEEHVLSEDPCSCVENESITDPTLAPKGMSTLYTFAPVSHQHPNIDWNKEKARYRELLVSKFERVGIRDLEKRIRYERVITPNDWDVNYQVHLGSVFNLAHSLGQLLSRR